MATLWLQTMIFNLRLYYNANKQLGMYCYKITKNNIKVYIQGNLLLI